MALWGVTRAAVNTGYGMIGGRSIQYLIHPEFLMTGPYGNPPTIDYTYDIYDGSGFEASGLEGYGIGDLKKDFDRVKKLTGMSAKEIWAQPDDAIALIQQYGPDVVRLLGRFFNWIRKKVNERRQKKASKPSETELKSLKRLRKIDYKKFKKIMKKMRENDPIKYEYVTQWLREESYRKWERQNAQTDFYDPNEVDSDDESVPSPPPAPVEDAPRYLPEEDDRGTGPLEGSGCKRKRRGRKKKC